MQFEQLMQDLVNEPYDSLVAMARQSIADLIPYINEAAGGDSDKVASVFFGFIAISLAADGKLSQKEYEFVRDVMQADYTYDEVMEIAKTGLDGEWASALDELIDNLPGEMKSKAILLCCTFMAADETISRDEVKLIYKLMQK